MVAHEQRVRPVTEGGSRVLYQSPPRREHLVHQLLVDFKLVSTTDPWPLDDEDAFADKFHRTVRRLASHASSGESHAVRFVASVWGNKQIIKEVGAFDLVQAFASLDAHNRAIVTAWCQEPWLA